MSPKNQMNASSVLELFIIIKPEWIVFLLLYGAFSMCFAFPAHRQKLW